MNELEVDRSLPTLAADGMAARFFLSMLATAGLFYVNIMPAIVDGLIEGLAFTPQQAGYVGSANMYGAAIGALAVVFFVRRIPWRPAAYALLLTLIGMDLLSMLVASPEIMIGGRFVHGLVGGALVGIGFAVIARTARPDRTFGVLLVVQFGLGGLGNLYLPRLVPDFGTDVLFQSLILFSAITLAMIPFLDRYPVQTEARKGAGPKAAVAVMPLALTLTAIFLFQAANMGLFAFIIGLGRQAMLELDFITWTLALSGWIGIAGATLVVMMDTRFGRTVPLAVAMIFTVLGFMALHHSESALLFLLANCGMGVTWAFIIPYLLGLAAEFDKTGQMAALGGFASKMGLASGPVVAGLLLGGDENYGRMINVSALALVVCLLVVYLPAIRQDRIARRELPA
ncbi:MAG: MFS transporter [Pseudomonadota bacterium]